MRIGMVLDREFPPDDRVEKEARSLIKAGFEVHLLCFTFGSLPPEEMYKGIFVHRVFMPRALFKKLSALILTLPFYRRFWKRKIERFVRQNQIDALHIHDLPLVGTALQIKQKFGLPVVADMHENYPVFISEIKFANTFWGRLLISKSKWFAKEKEWLSRADRIVVVDAGMRDRIEKRLTRSVPFVVVPNSPEIDAVLASQEALPDLEERYAEPFVVFYFGGLDSRRGLDTLVEAAALLKDQIKPLKVVIVGTGSYGSVLRERIKQRGVQDLFDFQGWHPVSHLQAFTRYADVCVIPHLKSPQTDNSSPNKLFLYMLFKKPIVASNCRSIQKIVEENACGLIYESGNGEQLAEKILYVYRHPQEALKMGERGHRAVREKYDWSVGANRLVEMYRGLSQ